MAVIVHSVVSVWCGGVLEPWRYVTKNSPIKKMDNLIKFDGELIRDMINRNELLVENFNFNFLTPLSHNFKMLPFDANPIAIGYLVTEI